MLAIFVLCPRALKILATFLGKSRYIACCNWQRVLPDLSTPYYGRRGYTVDLERILNAIKRILHRKQASRTSATFLIQLIKELMLMKQMTN